MRDNREPSQRSTWTRRGWLSAASTTVLSAAVGGVPLSAHQDAATVQQPAAGDGLPLRLTEFQPKNMLHVKETSVPRSRFPVIDFHTHVSFRQRAAKPTVPAAELIKTMDAVNLHTMSAM